MSLEESLLLCYNKGCGSKFNTNDNTDASCTFHPGAPVFHDAYKGWSCCSKKVTDFTEFLNIKGCTKGPHNPVKPPEPEKSQAKDETISAPEELTACAMPAPLKPVQSAPRIKSETLVPLQKVPAPQLVAKLNEATEARRDLANGVPDETGTPAGDAVTPGTSCKNNKCAKTYVDERSDAEACWSHPGVPIFHEGLKFWSCCRKRTSDFDAFLAQQGCTLGQHKWIADSCQEGELELKCRYDWHQTASGVTLAIYAKNTHPDYSVFEANATYLNIRIRDLADARFDMRVSLWGAILPEKSSVAMTPNKVEVKLKKAEFVSWPRLDYIEPNPTTDDPSDPNSDDL